MTLGHNAQQDIWGKVNKSSEFGHDYHKSDINFYIILDHCRQFF